MSLPDLARLVTLAALWGGSFAFIRVAAPVVGPLWLAESRVFLAFAILLALALSRGGVPAWRERWRDFLVIGIINSALPFALFCFAGQYIRGVGRGHPECDQSVFRRAGCGALAQGSAVRDARSRACRSGSLGLCFWSDGGRSL